jgi:dTDP-4-dehydrorhamnose 3,5-epimerase
MIEGVQLTTLKIITGDSGDVLHAIKRTESSFFGFGEAYFSTINEGSIKAWKRHHKMILNLVVPCGKIRFVIYDDRHDSSTRGKIDEVNLSRQNYQRLTIPPMVWFGFKGLGDGLNILMNVSNIPHDPAEYDKIDAYKNHINYQWD